MYPVLFTFGPFTFYTYGLFMVIGFIAGTILALSHAQKEGVELEKVLDVCFYVALGAIAGARFFYVVINHQEFIGRPLDVFKIWNGGLVFYGGFIGAVTAGLWGAKRLDLPFWKTSDLLAPSLALSHAIGRWGCLAAGSCYGRPTDSWLGITFNNPTSIAPTGIPLYPTQIFDSLIEFAILLILLSMRTKRKFDGQLFLMWAMLYAAGRFIIEYFRGDTVRGFFIPDVLSTSQGIGIVVFLVSATLLIYSAHDRTKALQAVGYADEIKH